MQKSNSIVELVFDIFFETTAITENFLGLIAQVDGFEEIIKLPILQIPEAIRKNDPNFKFQPLYEIRSKTNADYRVMLGDGMVGVAINKEYKGWDESFYPQIKKLFTTFLTSDKVVKINRIGLRYVNFLPNENIFETGKLDVKIANNEACKKKIFLKIEDCIENICYSKTVANNAEYVKSSTSGSIIDIVTFIESGTKELLKETIFEDINRLHDISKEKFKEVISNEYIKQHNL